MNIQASAPGKLVLLGEYALLHGAPAMVAAIDRRVTLEVVPTDRNSGNSLDITHLKTGPMPVDPDTLAFGSDNLTDDQADEVRAIMAVLRSTKMFSYARRKYNRSLSLTIDASPLFSGGGIKYGFGSSAAITVAISGLAAFLRDNSTIHANQLLHRSIHIHRSMQSQMGSGIDVAASTVGGILKFQLTHASDHSLPSLNRLAPLSGVLVTAVWTGQSASTAFFLAGLARFKARQPKAYRIVMQRLTHVCRQGMAAYQKRQPSRFLAAIDEYSRGLIDLSIQSDLPIFSPVHQQLARIARDGGGLYKPSGAGGGDVGLSFTDNPRKRDRMAAGFTRAGFQVFDLKWGVNGFSLKERKDE